MVKELDGLKEQREYGGPRTNWSGPTSSTVSEGPYGRSMNNNHASLTVTAQRARRVIGFLQEQMAPTQPNESHVVRNHFGRANDTNGSSFCRGIGSNMKGLGGGLSSLADDSSNTFVVGFTDAEVATVAPALSGGSSGSMTADTKILSTAIAIANHLGQAPLNSGNAESDKSSSAAPGGSSVTGDAKPLLGSHREDPVYLCTSDKNLALLAAVHGIRAGNLAKLRAELADREAAWRHAYARDAIAAAQGLSAPPV